MAGERDLRRADQGVLLIADISGYTAYLVASELEHAQNVLADLLDVIVAALSSTFRLSQLEGDAAFVFRVDAKPSGSLVLDAVEQTYVAFRDRLRDITRATTCRCNACRCLPDLELKFAAHHGSFIVDRVHGSDRVTGPDVIVIHRLLKNHVAGTFGTRSYALYTDALLRRAGLDLTALNMERHTEGYEHIGEVPAHVQRLVAAWERRETSAHIEIANDALSRRHQR